MSDSGGEDKVPIPQIGQGLVSGATIIQAQQQKLGRFHFAATPVPIHNNHGTDNEFEVIQVTA